MGDGGRPVLLRAREKLLRVQDRECEANLVAAPFLGRGVDGSLDDRLLRRRREAVRVAFDHRRVGRERNVEELLRALAGVDRRTSLRAAGRRARAPRPSRGRGDRSSSRRRRRSTPRQRDSEAGPRLLRTLSARQAVCPEPRKFMHARVSRRRRTCKKLEDAIDLVRRHRVRAGERAGADGERRRGAQAPFQLRSRAGRRPHRLPEGLQGGGRKARARGRDRQGLRGEEGQVGLPRRRGFRVRGAREGAGTIDIHAFVEEARSTRSTSSAPSSSPADGGEGLRAPRPRHGGNRLAASRPSSCAIGSTWLPTRSRARDPTRAMHFADEIRPAKGLAPKGVRVGKDDLDMAVQLVRRLEGVRAEEVQGHVSRRLVKLIRAKERGETVEVARRSGDRRAGRSHVGLTRKRCGGQERAVSGSKRRASRRLLDRASPSRAR